MSLAKSISMAELAKIAGVSASTVSLSLRGSIKIPAETQRRILSLAQKLGYKPNPLVSALMRSRRRRLPVNQRTSLALVNGLSSASGWRNSPSMAQRQIREGALVRARELGYQVEEFWLGWDGASPRRFSDILRSRGIKGILMGPLQNAVLPALTWDHFAAVGVDEVYKLAPLHVVCSDHSFAAAQAIRYCRTLGYRRPAMLLQGSLHPYMQRLLEGGFLAALANYPDVEIIAPPPPSTMTAEGRFSEWGLREWLLTACPDVLFTHNAELLEGCLAKIGYRVPQDIGLVSFECAEPDQRHSGISQKGFLMGRKAMETLVEQMELGERGLPEHPVTTLIEGHWNPGATLRPMHESSDRVRLSV